MLYPSAYIALFAATTVLSLPLNINLGAYSPALVVGDGAIGFEGANSQNQVANLMNTLQGAAANGAATPAKPAAAPAAPGASAAPAILMPAAASAGDAVAAQSLPQGMGKVVSTTTLNARKLTAEEECSHTKTDVPLVQRDLAGFNAALTYSLNAIKTGPEVQLGTGSQGAGVGVTQKAGGMASTPGAAH
ncbi:hypothetical protein QTJ16_004248 [Diplocarpon rosae]|uniref:Uncharacterized protein n=1 Tax=Diplocarpon rosae TaxID=946125 RepID=A0AAD9SYA6_9HELO|nr:hypothetical protein QTJ16_004248 [Diplocarpon rosae]